MQLLFTSSHRKRLLIVVIAFFTLLTIITVKLVAIRRDEKVYVQVCRNLPEQSDREIANLLEIKDHYPKYVVTLDDLAGGNINGVKIIHLADFLLLGDY